MYFTPVWIKNWVYDLSNVWSVMEMQTGPWTSAALQQLRCHVNGKDIVAEGKWSSALSEVFGGKETIQTEARAW